jgi:hypothetical protein
MLASCRCRMELGKLRMVVAVSEMTDEQFLKHAQLSHGVNSAGYCDLWECKLHNEDIALIDALHCMHHDSNVAIPCLDEIDHVHEEEL